MALSMESIFPPADERDEPVSNKQIYDEIASTGYIKRVQQGVITVAAGAATGTVTITSIDPANSIIYYAGHDQNTSGTYSTEALTSFKVGITDATTVTATRGAATNGYATQVYFRVVEYNPKVIKSKQPISVTKTVANYTPETVDINTVDLTKTILVFKGYTTTDTGTTFDSTITNGSVYFASNISVAIETSARSITGTMFYDVVEFY